MQKSRGVGRAIFASVLLFLDGSLNIIYGLAAIGNSSYFEHPTHYLVGSLNSWGWIALIIGLLELVAAWSVLRGHTFGRYVGIAVGACAAVAALLDIDSAPFWSLAVFGVSIWIIYGLATYSDSEAPYEPGFGPSTIPQVGLRPPA